MKKRLKIIGLSLGTLLLLTLLGVFIFREDIVSSLVDKYVQKVEANYNVTITYNSLTLDGVGEVNLQGVCFTQEEDTIGRLDSISVTFPFWKTVFGNRKLSSVNIVNGELNPYKYKSAAKDTTITKKQETTSKIERLKRVVKKASKLLPDVVKVSNITTHLNNKLGVNSFVLDTFTISNDSFILKSNLVDTLEKVQVFNWSGKLEGHIGVQVHWDSDSIFRMKVGKGVIGFKDIKLNIGNEDSGFRYQFAGDSLMLQHYRIAKNPVYFNKVFSDKTIIVGDRQVKTDERESVTTINEVGIYWYLSYSQAPTKQFRFGFNFSDTAEKVVNALPKGIFTKIDKLKTRGNIGYKFAIDVDFSNLDSLELISEVDGKSFQVYGLDKLGLTRMNDTFTHTVKTDKGNYSVGVGEGLPYFTPIEEVPRHLIDAILTNEDPSFFSHRGFIESAFRESLIANIKERRFKRGASTISMQLVKNLFLSKEKTLARKIEEICLVWILENKHITPKERMFEVYLNIIEWGPGIYGIEQAAEFYFSKKPKQLTLEESLYLASIIPRPKSFKYTFDKQGNIRPHYVEQFHFIKNLMVKRELIAPEDTLGFNPNIQLKGAARKQVLPDEEGVLEKVGDFFNNLF